MRSVRISIHIRDAMPRKFTDAIHMYFPVLQVWGIKRILCITQSLYIDILLGQCIRVHYTTLYFLSHSLIRRQPSAFLASVLFSEKRLP